MNERGRERNLLWWQLGRKSHSRNESDVMRYFDVSDTYLKRRYLLANTFPSVIWWTVDCKCSAVKHTNSIPFSTKSTASMICKPQRVFQRAHHNNHQINALKFNARFTVPTISQCKWKFTVLLTTKHLLSSEICWFQVIDLVRERLPTIYYQRHLNDSRNVQYMKRRDTLHWMNSSDSELKLSALKVCVKNENIIDCVIFILNRKRHRQLSATYRHVHHFVFRMQMKAKYFSTQQNDL